VATRRSVQRSVPRRTAVIPRSRPPREPGCSTVLRRTQLSCGRSTRRYVRARPPTRLSLSAMGVFSRTRVPPPSPTSRGPGRLDPLRSIRRGPRPTGVWLAPRTRRGPRPFTGPRLAPRTRAGPRRSTSRRVRIRPGPRCAISRLRIRPGLRCAISRLRIRPGLRCAISHLRPTTSLRRPFRVRVGWRMSRSGLSAAAVLITGAGATGTASGPSGH
jgi:hypothetical protein